MNRERPDSKQRKEIAQSQTFKVECPLGCGKAFYKHMLPDHIVDEHSD